MKTLSLLLPVVAVALFASACGAQKQEASDTESAGFSFPKQSLVLNGADAAALIRILDAAGVNQVDAIESTQWTTDHARCDQSFDAKLGLLSSCAFGLEGAVTPTSGVGRPAVEVSLDDASAKSLIRVFKRAGVQPLSAIESTQWNTGAITCSRSFQAKAGLISECQITLK